MPITGGVQFTGFISPTSEEDTYPVTKPVYGLGGLRNVGSTSERDAISSQRREQGMLVFVENESKYYKLVGGTANTDWSEFSSGLAGPTGPTGESISSVGISFGRLIVTKNTGETLDAGYVVGPTGPTGDSYIAVSGPDFSSIGINALNFVQGTNVTIGTTFDGFTASVTFSVININAGDYN